ncbi:MAG: PTS ascorbate transporter subunit IIB [Actinobacteria bacterium]|nr:PTS ascorbate transporter subunit IIB [Actinomycetota bacterium]
MKIIAVCGMGIGTSVLLKINAEKVLRMLDLEATVEAADVATVRKVSSDAQIILTTPDLVDQLQGLPAEIISIQHVFDLEELSIKLSKALL